MRQRYRKHYEIRWTGLVAGTLDEVGAHPGRYPRGGRHVRTREQAEGLLRDFFARCKAGAAVVERAHKPRIVEVEDGHDELG